jgi:hypothetical protein
MKSPKVENTLGKEIFISAFLFTALVLTPLLWTSAAAQDNAIAILGASTSAGTGATTYDSS